MSTEKESQIPVWQQAIADGSEVAFNNLFRHFYLNLVHFAMDIVHSKSAAEEIVSDVFVKIWQQQQDIMRIQNLRVFLFVAVKNRSYNYLRDHSGWTVELTDDNVSVLVQGSDPESDLHFRELQLQLHKVIEALPEQCRLVYKLVREDGLKFREVAEILQISPRTVETQLYRAVRKIRKVLLPDVEDNRENYNVKNAGNAVILWALLFS